MTPCQRRQSWLVSPPDHATETGGAHITAPRSGSMMAMHSVVQMLAHTKPLTYSSSFRRLTAWPPSVTCRCRLILAENESNMVAVWHRTMSQTRDAAMVAVRCMCCDRTLIWWNTGPESSVAAESECPQGQTTCLSACM